MSGPFYLDDERFCRFVDEAGDPLLEVFGMPWDELPPTWRSEPMTVTGHVDDAEAATCVSRIEARPDAEAVVLCRLMFHFDAIRPAS